MFDIYYFSFTVSLVAWKQNANLTIMHQNHSAAWWRPRGKHPTLRLRQPTDGSICCNLNPSLLFNLTLNQHNCYLTLIIITTTTILSRRKKSKTKFMKQHPPPSTTNPYGAKRYAANHDGTPAKLLSSGAKGTQDWCLTVDSADPTPPRSTARSQMVNKRNAGPGCPRSSPSGSYTPHKPSCSSHGRSL